MIKTLKFLSEKIVIVEVMLIILYLAGNYFGVIIPYLTEFITISLKYLTPVSIVALIIYIISSLMSHQFIKLLLAITLIILSYIYFIKRV